MGEFTPNKGITNATNPNSCMDGHLDAIEGLPKVGGKSMIFVVVNRFSKYAHFMAVQYPYRTRQLTRLYSPETILHSAHYDLQLVQFQMEHKYNQVHRTVEFEQGQKV